MSEGPHLAIVKPGVKEPFRGQEADDFVSFILSREFAEGPINVADIHGVEGCGETLYVDRVLSESECLQFCRAIEGSPKLSFWNADESQESKARLFRDADTIELYSEALAACLWNRVLDCVHLPSISINEEDDESSMWERELRGEWHACGLNADMLFARYKPGGHFAPHTDGRAIKGLLLLYCIYCVNLF